MLSCLFFAGVVVSAVGGVVQHIRLSNGLLLSLPVSKAVEVAIVVVVVLLFVPDSYTCTVLDVCLL